MKSDVPVEPDDNPADIRDALSVLKHIRTSPAASSRYRTIVEAELAMLPASRVVRLPWWKRSVQVPLPVAVAAGMLLIFSTWTAQMSWNDDSASPSGVGSQPPKSEAEDMPGQAEPFRATSDDTDKLALSVSETYLRGVGRLHTETRYVIKESCQ